MSDEVIAFLHGTCPNCGGKTRNKDAKFSTPLSCDNCGWIGSKEKAVENARKMEEIFESIDWEEFENE